MSTADQLRELLDSQTITVVVGAVLAEYIRRVGKKADDATAAATLAATRSAPTGNGYASRTEASLARIEATQEDQSRDIGGIRAELRTTREQVDHVGRRLDRHLEDRK